ncbi:ribosomal RNA processing 8, methyltransferase, -like protein [Chelydra serpentina]|uniref:Ribosomal RNA-processing protein 8 n=1 Tax=Chelydra serpentina TaxID=8475 RepID=A0A8T1S1H2_CHESE|nr:ribosomal RNA processing 8, methyltransferase, -like protein [Chelydra serpentina]
MVRAASQTLEFVAVLGSQRGTLKVAEVASRFADIRAFVTAVTQLGFQIVSKDVDNPFFYMFDFSKTGPPRAGGNVPGLALRPCLYKKR